MSLLAVVLAMTLGACGQVDPVVMAVSMPECVHQGVTEMDEGNLRVSLTLNGIVDAGVELVELTGEHSYDELETVLTSGLEAWQSPPTWVRSVLRLRLGAAQGIDGVEETVELNRGTYALVCLDFTTTEANLSSRPATRLIVRP